MRLGDRPLGVGHRAYVIAEIGVNHDGDPSRALLLTDAAADAGADAVKLQLFETDRLMSSAAKLATYQRDAGETDPLSMLRRLELRIDDMAPVVERAHARGLHAIVTVFSVELVEQAETLPWDAYKTASPDLVHEPLLQTLVSTGKPLIISTGASTIDEVQRAAGWLRSAHDRTAMLQCVSAYPAPAASLEGIGAIHEATGLPTGYSDHTPSERTGADAVAQGAVMLEKHLTDDRAAPGPDHAASLEPDQMKRYIAAAHARAVQPASQGGTKPLLDAEQDVRSVSRQSITAARPIPRGRVITREDLTFKRPGIGLEPWRLEGVLGQEAAVDIAIDEPMMPNMIRNLQENMA